MVAYEIIKQTFEKESCKLVTTEEEKKINNLQSTSKYKIIASCGHIIENCWFHMFKYRGTGKICKMCIDKEHSSHSKDLNKEVSYSLKIEHQSINIIKKYITQHLEIKISPECCTADISIRNLNCIENKWLPIQVKSTIKPRHNIYSFALSRNYDNMIMIFICIEDEKIWVLNGNSILNQCKISIGVKKSKYDIYEVKKEELSKKLLELYDNNNTEVLENIQVPNTKCYKTEHTFRLLREQKLKNIYFEYPPINQQLFDFKIKGNKIQEKVAFIRKNKKFYMALLSKNKNGVHNNPYDAGDNDFYWINLQDKETFYIIPEHILIEKQIITNNDIKGKRYISFHKKNTWLNEYKFLYNTENINEIINNYFKMKLT